MVPGPPGQGQLTMGVTPASSGSLRVGKIVMTAASKHLTPVTLELGGKNPCYVDDDCDPQTVAHRVVFFRYFNTGQTCVAPDYVLCSPETQERLLPALQNAITRFYGDDPRSSPDLGRIISEKHFQRLRGLLGCGRVAIGGQSDEGERYIGESPVPAAHPGRGPGPRPARPETLALRSPARSTAPLPRVPGANALVAAVRACDPATPRPRSLAQALLLRAGPSVPGPRVLSPSLRLTP